MANTNDKFIRGMMETMYLACPICGKPPKIHTERYSGNSAAVTIRCKRLFRKAHLSVTSVKASAENALFDATEKWNSEAIDIENWKHYD